MILGGLPLLSRKPPALAVGCVTRLIDEGKTVQEISKQLGMRAEEVFRLTDFTREDFLNMMTQGTQEYSKAQIIRKV